MSFGDVRWNGYGSPLKLRHEPIYFASGKLLRHAVTVSDEIYSLLPYQQVPVAPY